MTITFQIPVETKGQLAEIRKNLSASYSTKSELSDFHSTIYQCKLPEEKLSEAISRIESIAKKYSTFSFEYEGLNIKNEYVGIAYTKTPELEFFHEEIINTLNSLRNGLIRSTYVEKRDLYSSKEQAYIDQFGYPYVLDLYQPHIALIALENKAESSSVAAEIIIPVSFTSTNLEIVIISEEGKTIKSIMLG